jgi:hypothetical protein
MIVPAFTFSLQAVYRQFTRNVDTDPEMKRLLLLLCLAAALALPVAVSAAGTDGSLSVKRGHATIVLKLRGTTIGRMARGTVRIRDMNPYDNAFPQVRHCRTLRYPNPYTTLCTGKKLVFRAVDGRFQLRVKGSGIYLSAVGRGSVTLQGAGSLTVPNGLMSLDDGPYQPIPDEQTTYPLGTALARS